MLAVWLASTLGLVHRTLHVPEAHYTAMPVLSMAEADAVLAQKAAAAAHKARHAHGLFALFGDHSVSDCNLYDQFAGWHVPMSVPPVVLPIVLPAATFAWLQGEALARWVALFDARGPPSTR